MRNFFMSVSFLFCAFVSATPQEFIANLKQSALQTLDSEPLLQGVNKNLLSQCIQSICDTGYLELSSDFNHSVAELTLGIFEKTFANMIISKDMEIAIGSFMHALPDLSLRYKSPYTENLSSLLLTEEKKTALEFRSFAVESLMNTNNTGLSTTINIYYAKDDYGAFSSNPLNQSQIDHINKFIEKHPSARLEEGRDAPPINLEGALYKIRQGGIFFTFVANIQDQTSESPTALKFYLIFPYSNPRANRQKQNEGVYLANNIQYFFPR